VVNATGEFEAAFIPDANHPETNYDYGTTTHSITVTVVEDRLKGDGDGSGSIEITDINLLANLVAGMTLSELDEEDMEALDMDNDSKFTVMDLLKLAKLFVGIDS
jgi:hypothetical protein